MIYWWNGFCMRSLDIRSPPQKWYYPCPKGKRIRISTTLAIRKSTQHTTFFSGEFLCYLIRHKLQLKVFSWLRPLCWFSGNKAFETSDLWDLVNLVILQVLVKSMKVWSFLLMLLSRKYIGNNSLQISFSESEFNLHHLIVLGFW